MKKNIVILIALVTVAVVPVRAQFAVSYNETNNLFYHMQRMPQSNLLNPALFPNNNSFYLQLPSVNLLMGLPFSVHDVGHYDATQDANIINVNDVLDQLDKNPMRLGFDLGLLGFGFKINNFFFDFNTQIKMNLALTIPSSVASALLQGNMDENGNPIKEMTFLSGNLFNTQAYLETSIGAGYHIDPINLTVGMHAKLLSGMFNVNTENTNIYIETDEDFKKLTVHVYYEAMEAAAVPIDTTGGGLSAVGSNMSKHIGEMVTNALDPFNGNTGLAFDLGLKYDLGPLTFSASINDLSQGIHWQNNVNSVSPAGGEGVFEITGLDYNSFMNNGNMNMDSLTNELMQQIKNMQPKFTLDGKDYWYNVPTKVNVGVNYNFMKVFRAGVLLHGQFDRGLLVKKTALGLNFGDGVNQCFRFNATASLGMNLFNWAEFILANSFVYDGTQKDIFNPGAGFVLAPGTFLQIYFMGDYVSSIYWTDIKTVNLKLGVNLLFGNGGRKTIHDN